MGRLRAWAVVAALVTALALAAAAPAAVRHGRAAQLSKGPAADDGAAQLTDDATQLSEDAAQLSAGWPVGVDGASTRRLPRRARAGGAVADDVDAPATAARAGANAVAAAETAEAAAAEAEAAVAVAEAEAAAEVALGPEAVPVTSGSANGPAVGAAATVGPGRVLDGGRQGSGSSDSNNVGVVLNDVLADALALARSRPIKIERDQYVVVELKPKLTDLRPLLLQSIAAATTNAERRQIIYDRLNEVAATSRARLVALLQKHNVEFTPLWITNSYELRSRAELGASGRAIERVRVGFAWRDRARSRGG